MKHRCVTHLFAQGKSRRIKPKNDTRKNTKYCDYSEYSDYSDYRYQKKDAMRNSEEPANVSVCFRVMLVYVSFLFVL